jgi:hypothetical protein
MGPHPVFNSLIAIIIDNYILDYISDIINKKISLLDMITDHWIFGVPYVQTHHGPWCNG